jgi:hypothetical protein
MEFWHRTRFMAVGNAHHNVALPYNYWSERQWREAFAELRFGVEHWQTMRLGILSAFTWRELDSCAACRPSAAPHV